MQIFGLGREYFVESVRYGSEMCDVVLILLINTAALIDVFTFHERQHFNRFYFDFPFLQHLQMSEAFQFELNYDETLDEFVALFFAQINLNVKTKTTSCSIPWNSEWLR